MNEHVKRTLQIAKAEVGVREIGNTNNGKRVNEYQAADTLSGGGYPWCASFVVWCEREAARALKVKPILKPSASCDDHLDFANRRNILSSTPEVGDLFLVMASKSDATHIGYVLSVEGGRFITVEGNTNTGGSRNGNGVYTNRRPITARYKFVRWANLCASTTPMPPWALVIGPRTLSAELIDGKAWIPAHEWAHALGLPLGWNAALQTVTLQGRDVPSQVKMVEDAKGENRAWLPVRKLADFSGLKLEVAPGRIEVVR